MQTKKLTWNPETSVLQLFCGTLYLCFQKIYYLFYKMRTNSKIWIKKNLKVRRGPCGWLVLSEFLTVIITHSQAQLSTWESSIQNPAKPAVLFFSFFCFCRDLVWPFRDVLSFATLHRGFYGALHCFASQWKCTYIFFKSYFGVSFWPLFLKISITLSDRKNCFHQKAESFKL